MKQSSWLEITEYTAIAGSGLGTIAAAVYSNAIYAAAPLTVAVSLNIINRQRFQTQTRQDTKRDITDVQNAIEEKIEALPLPPEPVNLHPVEWKVAELTHQVDILIEQFQSRPEKRAIAQLIGRHNTLAQEFHERTEKRDIAQIQQRLNILTQQFNNRAETQLILQITSELNTLAQQFHQRPEAQSINELKHKLESLTQRFVERADPQEIQQIREDLHVLSQLFCHRAEPKDISKIKQQIDLLNQKFENRPEPQEIAKTKQEVNTLKQEIAQLRQQFTSQLETHNLEILNELNTLGDKFNNRSEKQLLARISDNLAVLTRQVSALALAEPIDLSDIKTEITQYSVQLQTIRRNLDTLNQQFQNRPEKYTFTEIEASLDILTQQVNEFVLAKPVDLSEIKNTITEYSLQLENLRKHLNTLNYEFNNRPEKQAIARLERTLMPPVEESVRQWSVVRKPD